MELCERETIRMLQIIRHLFYASDELLVPLIMTNENGNNQNISKLSNVKKPVSKKETLADKLMSLWSQIFDELGTEAKYNEILCETYRGMITFSA